jgi:endonuclease YncB( thermonuclease family)
VVDGDTIDVTSARTGTLRVRLEGIDTPERGEPFSRHATNCLRRN